MWQNDLITKTVPDTNVKIFHSFCVDFSFFVKAKQDCSTWLTKFEFVEFQMLKYQMGKQLITRLLVFKVLEFKELKVK